MLLHRKQPSRLERDIESIRAFESAARVTDSELRKPVQAPMVRVIAPVALFDIMAIDPETYQHAAQPENTAPIASVTKIASIGNTVLYLTAPDEFLQAN